MDPRSDEWDDVDEEEWAHRQGIDTTHPRSARVYSAWLDSHEFGTGKDTFAADRELAARIAEIQPQTPQSARHHRRFLGRVVRRLAREHGIDQFVDVGSGLPTRMNVHQVAQEINPDARVLYGDNDPVVAVHARALLTENARVRFAVVDVSKPRSILGARDVRGGFIDLSRPVGLLLLAVVHFVHCHDDEPEHPDYDPEFAYRAVRPLIDALPSGSWVGFSHLTAEGVGEQPAARVVQAWKDSNPDDYPVTRTRAQIERFLDGLEVEEPGLVQIDQWRPDVEDPPMEGFWLYGGIARKP